MKWKSIETAPKDGTHVLLFFPNQDPIWLEEGGIIEGKFKYKKWEVVHLDRHGRGDDCSYKNQPTHWMSLPEKPKEE